MDQLYPEVGMNTVKVLEKVGCEILYNENQTCCGQPAFNAGYMKEAKSVCTKFLNDFSGNEIIVAPSGSCVGFIRSQIDSFFGDSLHKERAVQLKNNIYELSEFLVDISKSEDLGARFDGKATYHDACGALNECGIKAAPRKLLSKVKGLELLESDECETCCGFGGTFAINYEPISIGMAHTKVQSALSVGVDYIISTDVSCLMHLDGYVKKQGIKIETLHLADVLAKF
jgi:L-lactate dehydrogenase complex protein LldE